LTEVNEAGLGPLTLKTLRRAPAFLAQRAETRAVFCQLDVARDEYLTAVEKHRGIIGLTPAAEQRFEFDHELVGIGLPTGEFVHRFADGERVLPDAEVE